MQDARNTRRSERTNDRAGASKRTIFRRTVFLMAAVTPLMFAALIWKLWDVSIVHHEEYQQQATNQQTMELSVSADRGVIYDRNGNVLSMSATVYDLIVSPRDLLESVDEDEYTDEDTGEVDEAKKEAAIAAKQAKIAADLKTMLPDLDPEFIDKQVYATKYAYRELKTSIEEADAEALRTYIVENKTSRYLYLNANTKRYYPYSELAAQVLGFVNANGGAYGIEATYDGVLKGTPGRVVTAKTGSGTQMHNSYSEYIDAMDGCNVTLTLDATIQSYLEKTLQEGIEEFDVRNGAFGVAMNPKTGAIYAIASAPEFDPNNYAEITDEKLLAQVEEKAAAYQSQYSANNTESLTQEEIVTKALNQAKADARNSMWRSKAVNDMYEPGSTFKAVVLAAALEEGLVSANDTFMCTGSYKVAGWNKGISCSKKEGHGLQTLAEAVQNSCNPAFMQIGQRLGVDRFYDYFEAFGMTGPTGIDLPGESAPKEGISYWKRENMTGVDLAVASFGQRFDVTPIQMATAFAATINGGYLVKPYVVQSVSSQDGTILSNTEPTIVRQVVSEQTSALCAEILESVVGAPKGTGKNAYVAGYRIGGKTGTSEIKTLKGEVIVSFMGFAPADDPEVLVLIAYDRPARSGPGSNYGTTGIYISGGNMPAKKMGPLMAEILDYLGVEKKYTTEESAAVDVKTPNVKGIGVKDAEGLLSKNNLKYRTVGEGATVVTQIPAPQSSVPGGSTVILYLGDTKPEETAVIPNVVGLSYEAAKNALEAEGFFMRAGGVSVYYSDSTIAQEQSVAAGETAAIGTVVNVQFANMVEDGWVDTGL